MSYITKKYLDIEDVDRTESNYCVSGRYYLIDSKKISFEDWVKKSLDFDEDVDFTYWEFDKKIEGELANRFIKSNRNFKQKKYIITNRRVVHAFDNSQKFHRSFHTKPESIADFIMGIYRPTRIRHFPKDDTGTEAYMIRNAFNKIKSYLNVHDKKIMKIQTSFLNEEYEYILNIDEIFTSNISMFDETRTLNESENKLLEEKYVLLGRWLYTLNPNMVVERGSKGIILEGDQLIFVINNADLLKEEFGCDYYLEENIISLDLID